MNKLREAIRLALTTTMSNRKIGVTVGLSHTTIAKYRRVLTQCGQDWPTIDAMDDIKIEGLLKSSRKCTQLKRLPDWVYIHKEMQKSNMTLQLLWEEYCMADPDSAYGYSSFAYKFSKFKRKLNLSMRQSHRAGECVFVDFAGTTIPYTNLDTEEELSAQVFVGAMGCSNYTFMCALRSQSIPDWVEAHNKMFQYFGGTPEVIVPDNLKSAVTRAGRDLIINRTYLELCKYYGSVIIPARVRHPKDKSKAEVAVQIVSRWIIVKLRYQKFFSVEEINTAIAELLWQLNERPFKRLPGCRRSRFEELDKPLLRPLPGSEFEYAEWVSQQKVVSDYHIHVKDHYYSAPYQLVGSFVEARVTAKTVEIFNLGCRVASHVRSHEFGGHSTLPSHQPKSHRQYAEQTPEQMTKWASKIGKASLAVVNNQFSSHPHALLGLKACSSLKRLASVYGSDRFESACQRAQSIGSLTIKSVRSILQRGLAELTDENIPLQINLPLHHNVRGATYYTNEDK